MISRDVVAFITNISIVTIEWLCFKILLDYLSEQKTSSKTRFLTFIICISTTAIAHNYSKSLLYIIAGFGYYKLNYATTLFKSVIVTSVFWVGTFIMKVAGIIVLSKISKESSISVYQYFGSLEIMMFSVLIFIGTALLYKYFKSYKDINKKHFLCIFFPILTNIISLGIVFINKTDKMLEINMISEFSVFIMGVLMLISNIFMVVLFRKIIRDNKINMENAIMKEKMEMEYKYYSNMKEHQIRVRQLYHDIKNHMMCISNLKDNTEIIKDYISDINLEISKCENNFNTGNMILDIILNEKQSICMDKGIEFISHIDFSKCDFIKMKDVCTVFSNIIDNAIEACEKIDKSEIKKEIYLKSTYINENFFVMKIENSKLANIKIDEENLTTDKEDTFIHGIGMGNIKNTIDEYNGQVNIDCTDYKFIMKILIPLN